MQLYENEHCGTKPEARMQNCASSATANSRKTQQVSTMSIVLSLKPNDDFYSLIIVLLVLRSETFQDIFETKWIWPHAKYSVRSSSWIFTSSRHPDQPSSWSGVPLHSWPAYCGRRERYSPDHAFDIHRQVEAWQCRAKRSCIVCSAIFQSQQDTTKPTATVQILGISTPTWRRQYAVFYCPTTLDPTSFGNVLAHFARHPCLGNKDWWITPPTMARKW